MDPVELLSPAGAEALARVAVLCSTAGGAELAVAEALRRDYPADLAAAAMAQHELRLAARAKFDRAMDMLFTRDGYEQSSSELISRYRASRLAAARRVADLCCGIGGDLIALAPGASHRDVVAVDRDEAHARLALHNAAVYREAENVRAVVSDVRDLRLNGIDAVFIDPARRSGPVTAAGPRGPHRFKAGICEPPLDWCYALTETVAAVCVKAAPGLPADLIPPDWEAEFIADGRDLKEAVLWSPALATAPATNPADPSNPAPRRAAVLTPAGPGQPATCHTLVAHPGDPVPLAGPGEYLLDPNPAVTRAGLVEDLARTLGADAAKLDPQIAFITTNHRVLTPFARTLRVLDSAPWNEKRFARRLRELNIGAADIRRRGLAGDVDQIRRRLKLPGTAAAPGRATVVITRRSDKPWGLICADLE